jgi:hypothetical protein
MTTPITIVLQEEERQLTLMALAALSIERPGFDDALNRVALKMDDADCEGEAARAEMYDAFRSFYGQFTPAQSQLLDDELLGNRQSEIGNSPRGVQ